MALSFIGAGCFLRDAIVGPRGNFPQAGDEIILGPIKNLTNQPVIWDDQGLVDLFTSRERRGIDPKVKQGVIAALQTIVEDRGWALREEEVFKRRVVAPPPPPKTSEEAEEAAEDGSEEPVEPTEPPKRFLLAVEIVRWDATQLRPARELEAVIHFRLSDDIKHQILWEDANRRETIRGERGIVEWDLNRYTEEIVRDAFKTLPQNRINR